MKIKIHNDDWEVKVIDKGKKKMNPSVDSYNLGLTEYGKCCINIRDGMTRSVTRSTVIHELTHAFMFSYGYSVNDEEAMCDFFGANGDEIICLADQIMEGMIDCAVDSGNTKTN